MSKLAHSNVKINSLCIGVSCSKMLTVCADVGAVRMLGLVHISAWGCHHPIRKGGYNWSVNVARGSQVMESLALRTGGVYLGDLSR